MDSEPDSGRDEDEDEDGTEENPVDLDVHDAKKLFDRNVFQSTTMAELKAAFAIALSNKQSNSFIGYDLLITWTRKKNPRNDYW